MPEWMRKKKDSTNSKSNYFRGMLKDVLPNPEVYEMNDIDK